MRSCSVAEEGAVSTPRESGSQTQGPLGMPKFTLLPAWPEAADPQGPERAMGTGTTGKRILIISEASSICHLL